MEANITATSLWSWQNRSYAGDEIGEWVGRDGREGEWGEGGGRQYEELECHILSVAIYIHVSWRFSWDSSWPRRRGWCWVGETGSLLDWHWCDSCECWPREEQGRKEDGKGREGRGRRQREKRSCRWITNVQCRRCNRTVWLFLNLNKLFFQMVI